MLTVNFFESRLHFNIHIHRGGHVEVRYKNKPIVSGAREQCFKRISETVKELDNLGSKEIYFHIENMTIGDSAFRYDVIYFKEHLSVLKSQSKSYIEIKTGLYDTFA